MRFIKILLALVLITSSCKKNAIDPSQMKPPYRLLNVFSEKIKPITGLILTSYAYNWCLPNHYEIKNGIGNFSASYRLPKAKKDEITLEYARNLVVFITENLLAQINSDSGVQPYLDVFPFTSSLVKISIYFEDENRIELGQGISHIYFSRGKIKYEGYEIHEYTGKYPAKGKSYTIHEESYEEALEIVKNQGTLNFL